MLKDYEIDKPVLETDRRTDAKEAVKLIREADCIWLMGGEAK